MKAVINVTIAVEVDHLPLPPGEVSCEAEVLLNALDVHATDDGPWRFYFESELLRHAAEELVRHAIADAGQRLRVLQEDLGQPTVKATGTGTVRLALPDVAPIEQPACATCKHWKFAPQGDWEHPGTGIPLAPDDYESGPSPRSNHGRCSAMQHEFRLEDDPPPTKLLRRSPEEINAIPAVVCDAEEYSAWACTLPTFYCVMHEPRDAVRLPVVQGTGG